MLRSQINTDGLFSPDEVQSLLKIMPGGIIGFDIETTGLSPLADKIIEIAAVKVASDKTISTFHTLINPEISIPLHTIEYHGLTDDAVEDAIKIKEALESFSLFIEDFPLVAHNAQFDSGFIIKNLHEQGLKIPEVNMYDSCNLSRYVFKNRDKKPENNKLSSLAVFFSLPLRHHQALDDAAVSIQILAKIIHNYKFKNVKKCLIFNTREFSKIDKVHSKYDELVEYIKTQSPVEIKYDAGSYKGEFRPIVPIALLPLPSGNVVYAKCLKSDLNKNFKLEKIVSYRKSVNFD